jgi:L-lactate dehydrogenase complex protein LldG
MKSDKEIILKNIKESLSGSRAESSNDTELDYEISEKLNSITPSTQNELIHQFEKELEKVNAEFINIESSEDIPAILQKLITDSGVKKIAISGDDLINTIAESLLDFTIEKASEYEYSERKNKLSQIETALVFAENGIADTGSVVFYYDNSKTTYPHFLCDWTIILIKQKSIIANQFELMKKIDFEKAKNMVFVTGPSRTADIEKTLVLGAHGPRRVTVIAIP